MCNRCQPDNGKSSETYLKPPHQEDTHPPKTLLIKELVVYNLTILLYIAGDQNSPGQLQPKKQLIGRVVVEYRNPTTPPMAYEAK